MRIVESKCPRCHKEVDSAENFEDETLAPKEDDVTVCIYCQAVLQFNEDLSLREASTEAIAECMTEISIIQNAITKVRREK